MVFIKLFLRRLGTVVLFATLLTFLVYSYFPWSKLPSFMNSSPWAIHHKKQDHRTVLGTTFSGPRHSGTSQSTPKVRQYPQLPAWLVNAAIKDLSTPRVPVDGNINAFILPNIVYKVHMSSEKQYWNPSVIALPTQATADYLIVARDVTNGAYQHNSVCMAVWDEQTETLRCVTTPQLIEAASTAALQCGQANSSASKVIADIPGFHDARVMWSHNGEVLLIAGTQ